MLAEYLGEKNFRDGLRQYLKKHSYGNTETADLWNALSRVSGKPVANMMANWTGKPGYPLITVTDKGTQYELRQSRFFSSPISKKKVATRDTLERASKFRAKEMAPCSESISSEHAHDACRQKERQLAQGECRRNRLSPHPIFE